MDSKELRQLGFEGFRTIGELKENAHQIPQSMGVYAVIYTGKQPPVFLEKGTGGFFKNKNPNVSIDELKANWVEDSDIVYIGKAGAPTSSATLQSRLNQYLKFGMGKKIGHWGGRFIWRIAESDNLLVCWKATKEDPRDVEARMIAQFKSEHHGQRPFANLAD